MPALIVLSLVAVGIGIAVVYHGHATALFRSRTASARTPAIASGVPAALPPAGPAAIPPSAAPPAVADTKHAAASAPIPVLRPLPTAAAAMADSENCPYPRIAVDQGLTGTVFLLVDVASNGRPQKAKIEKTSGSDALDQAAISCVEQFGRFPASPSGSPSGGYRGRMHITWSFGT
jgi:protein TonB